MTFDTRQRLIELASGVFIESDVAGIAKQVTDYDANLRIQFCDPALADPGDAPYRLIELCPDGIPRVVFYIWELDGRVMQRILAADNQKLNVLSALEDHNAKVKLDSQRRYEDKTLELDDIVRHTLHNPKTNYTVKLEDTLYEISDHPDRFGTIPGGKKKVDVDDNA